MVKTSLPDFENLTKLYWSASSALSAGTRGAAADIAVRRLVQLARHCDHAALRCAAAGRLVSLGLSELATRRDAGSGVPPTADRVGPAKASPAARCPRESEDPSRGGGCAGPDRPTTGP